MELSAIIWFNWNYELLCHLCNLFQVDPTTFSNWLQKGPERRWFIRTAQRPCVKSTRRSVREVRKKIKQKNWKTSKLVQQFSHNERNLCFWQSTEPIFILMAYVLIKYKINSRWWMEELESSKRAKREPSLLRVIMRASWKKLLITAFFIFIVDVVIK